MPKNYKIIASEVTATPEGIRVVVPIDEPCNSTEDHNEE